MEKNKVKPERGSSLDSLKSEEVELLKLRKKVGENELENGFEVGEEI